MTEEMPTRVDELLNRMRNNRLLSILIVMGIIVIGLGAVSSALKDIRDFLFDTLQTSSPKATDNRPAPDIEKAPASSIEVIMQQLVSPDPLVRRMGVIALKDYPDQALSLLINSRTLGSIDTKDAREDTAFTSVVRGTLVNVGPRSVKPLIAEWRRTRDELKSRFEIYPQNESRNILRFLTDSLGYDFALSADTLSQRASKWGAITREDSAAHKAVAETKTLELLAALRNIQQTIAMLLRNYQVDDLDLSDLSIRGDFSGVNLPGANLSGSDLLQANFSGSDLSGANLQGANLNIANLSKANLINANLTKLSSGDGADFSDAKLHSADFSRSRAIGANFVNASLRNANFNETVLTRSDFSGADFTGTRITNALMRKATLSDIRGFEDIADMYLVNLRYSVGLDESRRKSAANRGAVWDDTVATQVNNLPPAFEFPSNLKSLISYRMDRNLLVWTGGRMDSKDRMQLQELDLGAGNQNAVFYLDRLTAYLN